MTPEQELDAVLVALDLQPQKSTRYATDDDFQRMYERRYREGLHRGLVIALAFAVTVLGTAVAMALRP